MITKTIKQTAIFPAGPHEVYEALMNSKTHSAFTGDKATISRKVGGSIYAYGGYIRGKNIKLVPDKLIEQSWQASDWPKNMVSVVKFELVAHKTGTKLTFTHTGVPDEQYSSIKQGWIDYYWEPMKDLFSKSVKK